MEQNRERKGLFKLFKSSSITRDKNSSTLNSPSVKPARSLISNKIHSQRQVERKEQRDKLITETRARTTSVSSNINSRHNTPSLPKPPSRTLASSVSKPLSKPPPVVPRLPPKTSTLTNNDTLSTTYTVDQIQNGSNLSRQGTISSLNRKKLLEDWRQKKQEQDKSKPKKPVFKPSGTDLPKTTLATGLVPTSSSFNFSMSMPGAGLTRSASVRKPEVVKPTVKPSVSKPPIRSQSVRQSNAKETPKFVPKIKSNNFLKKPTNVDKELEIITQKLNESMNIKPSKQLEIKIEEPCLNETRLDTVVPTHTSSPIKKQEFTVEYFEKIDLDKRDVKYYRDLVNFETQELNILSDVWTGVCSSDRVPDDIQGDIRSAVGLAKLLIDERFSQFNDLINQCEETSKSNCVLVVKCSDLQGFWDMVDVQVKDVCKKFELLVKIKENNYVKTLDMIEPLPVVVEKKVFKPNRNYLKKKDQKVEDKENEVEKVEKSVKQTNRLAEFKAKMKAMKAPSVEIEIQIAEPKTPESPKSLKKTRRSTRKSVAFNETPVEKKYNLRSRPSDLIKFDSPLGVRSGLENLAEEPSINQSPVAIIKKSKKKSIYPVIDEDELDKENDDLFSLDDCPQITWKTRPSIYPTAQVHTPSRLLIGTPSRVSMNRESLSSNVASSPLLKLALISSQSKRLSVNSLNRIFDKLE